MAAINDNREEITMIAKGENLTTTFNKLLYQANLIQNQCEDITIPAHRLSYSDFNGLMTVSDEDFCFSHHDISQFAMSQLCNKLGVPYSYIDKCLQIGNLGLVAENLNYWLENSDKNFFIRMYKNNIRGILSNRYSVLDTPDILDVLYNSIDAKKFVSKGYFISPERFHLRIVQKEMLNIPNEDLFAGVQIDSSDVGRSILIARFFIFKQVCTNGLIVGKESGTLFEQKHLGISKDNFIQGLQSGFSLLNGITANVEALIKEKMVGNKYTKVFKSESDFKDFCESLKYSTKLSDNHIEEVVDLMKSKYGMSQWSLVNSITEVAKNFTLERRLELEKVAGSLLAA